MYTGCAIQVDTTKRFVNNLLEEKVERVFYHFEGDSNDINFLTSGYFLRHLEVNSCS